MSSNQERSSEQSDPQNTLELEQSFIGRDHATTWTSRRESASRELRDELDNALELILNRDSDFGLIGFERLDDGGFQIMYSSSKKRPDSA